MRIVRRNDEPLEFGGEKELPYAQLGRRQILAQTEIDEFEPALAPGGAADWAQLSDDGTKIEYLKALAERTNQSVAEVIDKVQVKPTADYAEVVGETGEKIELISKKFDAVDGIKAWLDKYGWGHIHTSYVRGGETEQTQNQMTAWQLVANLYLFLHPLETRGPGMGGDRTWRFTETSLSIPTEEHMALAKGVFAGEDRVISAFAKHLLVAVRGEGPTLYGDPKRAGLEIRGGMPPEKRFVFDSLLSGLADDQWGAQPFEYEPNSLNLVVLGPDHKRSKINGELWHPTEMPPASVETIRNAIEEGVPGLEPEDADRLFAFLDKAEQESDADNLNQKLDHRVLAPLVRYERLPFIPEAMRPEIVEARKRFLQTLSQLERAGRNPSTSAHLIVQAVTDWAKSVQVGAECKKWMAGPPGLRPS